MSVIRSVDILCDGCGVYAEVEAWRVSDAREMVRVMGWVRRRGLDYCEACHTPETD